MQYVGKRKGYLDKEGKTRNLKRGRNVFKIIFMVD